MSQRVRRGREVPVPRLRPAELYVLLGRSLPLTRSVVGTVLGRFSSQRRVTVSLAVRVQNTLRALSWLLGRVVREARRGVLPVAAGVCRRSPVPQPWNELGQRLPYWTSGQVELTFTFFKLCPLPAAHACLSLVFATGLKFLGFLGQPQI